MSANVGSWIEPVQKLADLGGPVLVILLLVSIVTVTVALLKVWQYQISGVGRRKHLHNALKLWDKGDKEAALTTLARSRHFLASTVKWGMDLHRHTGIQGRLETDAEQKLETLESGFRFFDVVAQLSPLLGLLGTVLGMIEAFQALQDAGSQVDPSLLAGGIWVALVTTAAGLSVAMPTSIILSWLEARIDAERIFAEYAFATIISPVGSGQDVT